MDPSEYTEDATTSLMYWRYEGEDYPDWATHMKLVLMGLELWEWIHIDLASVKAAQKAKAQSKKLKAYSVICLNVSQSILRNVILKEAKDELENDPLTAWQALEKDAYKSEAPNILRALDNILDLKMKQAESAQDFNARMSSSINLLEQFEIKLDDRLYLCLYIRAIKSNRFNELKTTMRHRESLTLDEAMQMVRTEEECTNNEIKHDVNSNMRHLHRS